MVLLTSFKKAKTLDRHWKVFSVARFQPNRCYYQELGFLSATDSKGEKIKPTSTSEGDLMKFSDTLKEGYRARWSEIEEWLKSLKTDDRIALACWCPYSEDSRGQVKKEGHFACHTGLIGKLIKKHRPDIQVWLDDDRHTHLISEWKP
jgi:hypothetical protein